MDDDIDYGMNPCPEPDVERDPVDTQTELGTEVPDISPDVVTMRPVAPETSRISGAAANPYFERISANRTVSIIDESYFLSREELLEECRVMRVSSVAAEARRARSPVNWPRDYLLARAPWDELEKNLISRAPDADGNRPMRRQQEELKIDRLRSFFKLVHTQIPLSTSQQGVDGASWTSNYIGVPGSYMLNTELFRDGHPAVTYPIVTAGGVVGDSVRKIKFPAGFRKVRNSGESEPWSLIPLQIDITSAIDAQGLNIMGLNESDFFIEGPHQLRQSSLGPDPSRWFKKRYLPHLRHWHVGTNIYDPAPGRNRSGRGGRTEEDVIDTDGDNIVDSPLYRYSNYVGYVNLIKISPRMRPALRNLVLRGEYPADGTYDPVRDTLPENTHPGIPGLTIDDQVPFLRGGDTMFRGNASDWLLDLCLRGAKSSCFVEGVHDRRQYGLQYPADPTLNLEGNQGQKQPWRDNYFKAKMAFEKEEIDNFILTPGEVVEIKAKTSSVAPNPRSVDESRMVNFYRYHYTPRAERMRVNRTGGGSWMSYQDRIQKYTSDNIKKMQDANEAHRSAMNNYVEIEINTKQDSKIATLLQRYGMDKKVLEIIGQTLQSHYPRVFGYSRRGGVHRSKTDLSRRNYLTTQICDSSFGHRIDARAAIDEDGNLIDPGGEDWQATMDLLSGPADEERDGDPTVMRIKKIRSSIKEDSFVNAYYNVMDEFSDIAAEDTSVGYGFVDPRQYPMGYSSLAPMRNPATARFVPQQLTDIQMRAIKLADAIRASIFKVKFNRLGKSEEMEGRLFDRDYLDIISGKPAYSETIGYKINKHEVVDGVLRPYPIQTFYFMDSDEVDRINFIDSQVIGKKTYRYVIYTINFVVGQKYMYRNADQRSRVTLFPDGDESRRFDPFRDVSTEQDEEDWYYGESDAHKIISVSTIRDCCIIEAPYYSKDVTILDAPPMAPEVSFLPLQGVDNKIRILMEQGTGEIEQVPLPIFDSDREMVSEMYRSQGRVNGQKISFKNDSLPERYQLIRLESKPQKYEDFSLAEHSIAIPATGKTGMFEDSIEPNKTYYYTFRTFDDSGLSNPSPVYKFRMVSYHNGVFMQLEECNMARYPEQIKINFERYFQIKPSNIQRFFNFENHNLNERDFYVSAKEKNFSLGPSGDPSKSVWRRSFKIKVKSKETCRALEIDFSFNPEFRTIPEPEVIRVNPNDPSLAAAAEATSIEQGVVEQINESQSGAERLGSRVVGATRASRENRRSDEPLRSRAQRFDATTGEVSGTGWTDY